MLHLSQSRYKSSVGGPACCKQVINVQGTCQLLEDTHIVDDTQKILSGAAVTGRAVGRIWTHKQTSQLLQDTQTQGS
jgi:hypothetical protein